MFTISTFREAIKKQGGVAKPNLFQVNITNAPNGFPASAFTFQCKIATIPPSTMGVIEVPYFGRMIKIPGNRTFDNLSLTVLNDTKQIMRASFESWMSGMNSHEDNTTDVRTVLNADLSITHFDEQKSPTGKWDFVNCFPVSLGEIGLDWGSNDTAEEFSVDFAYDYWKSADAK